jgi:hypothetical protein
MNNRQINGTRAQSAWLRSLLICFTMISCVGISHAEGKLSGFAELAYGTDFLYRGFKVAGESFQPAVWGTYDDLSLGFWGVYGVKRDSILDPSGKFSESNFAGTYSFSQKHYMLTIGGTVYGINDLADPDTGRQFKYYFESYVQLALKMKFNPSISFWREFGHFKGNYVEFSITPSMEITKECRLSVRPYVGLIERGDRYFGVDLSVNYDFTSKFYARASVTLVHNNFDSRHDRSSFTVGSGLRW